MPKLTIDGREIDVAPGTTLIQAARRLGIEIPHFCWHPDLSVDGNCRMCLVEIEKQAKLQIACNTQATDGLIVHTDTPRVQAARRSTLEFLLVNHPIDCPVCDQAGECSLQDQYQRYTLHGSRTSLEDKVHKRKLVDLGPILLDAERCVLCGRCLRYEREVLGVSNLAFVRRGNRTEIATFENRPIRHNYAGNLADVCPVGALLSHDFRFRMRVWFLSSTPAVCPGCSTGCNIYLDHRDGEVHRLRPRRNPDVNKSWMCDLGRALGKTIASRERVTHAQKRAAPSWERRALPAALDLLADRLRQAGSSVAILASPESTNEDLFALRVLADATGALLDFRLGEPERRVRERADQVLLRADPNPNTQGALDLGIGRSGVDEIVEACRPGAVEVLLLAGPDLLRLPAAGILLANVPLVAAMVSFWEPSLERAHLVLPAALWAEADGTFTNYQRRVQRSLPAIAPPGEARPRWELTAGLLRRLAVPFAAASALDVFTLATKAVPSWAGLDYRALGDTGRVPAQEE